MVEHKGSHQHSEVDTHDGQGPHQAGSERHRTFVADAPDSQGDGSSASPGCNHREGFSVASRADQTRASPRRSDDGRGIDSGEKDTGRGRIWHDRADAAARAAQPRSPAGLEQGSQAARPRSGLGHRQDVGQGTTRESRRAPDTTDRAAASRSSRAARCRSRGGCQSAGSRISFALSTRSFV